MFDNYVGAKLVKRRNWVLLVVLISVALHAVVGAALVVRSFWVIEKLEPPDTELALGAPPPPPPPPPAGSSKPKTPVKTQVHATKVLAQPDPNKKPDPASKTESEDEGVEGGVEGGVAGGVVGGVLGGVEGGVLGAEEKPQEAKIVPQVALEAKRIRGEKDIQPPNDVATQISRSGKTAIGTVKMCITPGGTVQSLKTLRSTGYPAYDAKIKSKMHEWQYSPFTVNGKPVPVCTSVTFIYRPAK